jgi:hypothetical protein
MLTFTVYGFNFKYSLDFRYFVFREEAEYLQQCLDQAESAKTTMEVAKNEFERRSGQVDYFFMIT